MTSHKKAAVAFLTMITAGEIKKAYDEYAATNFSHHNPYFKGDAASLAQGMEENHKQFPNKIYEPKHILEDGDLVAVHGFLQLDPGKQVALVHILRFENDKIAEMWDIGETIPQDSPNENGMF